MESSLNKKISFENQMERSGMKQGKHLKRDFLVVHTLDNLHDDALWLVLGQAIQPKMLLQMELAHLAHKGRSIFQQLTEQLHLVMVLVSFSAWLKNHQLCSFPLLWTPAGDKG